MIDKKPLADREPWPGMDFFGDGFATVRKGNLPSGEHADPRMNLTLADVRNNFYSEKSE